LQFITLEVYYCYLLYSKCIIAIYYIRMVLLQFTTLRSYYCNLIYSKCIIATYVFKLQTREFSYKLLGFLSMKSWDICYDVEFESRFYVTSKGLGNVYHRISENSHGFRDIDTYGKDLKWVTRTDADRNPINQYDPVEQNTGNYHRSNVLQNRKGLFLHTSIVFKERECLLSCNKV
jgi:hypothetical protein